MASYYATSLQRDIERIHAKLAEMAHLADRALDRALRAFIECDRQAAYAVILRDRRIDELEREIDRLCLEFLVKQQPAAKHLRFVYSTIKINLELERVGDYAESVARQAVKLSDAEISAPIELFEEIGNLTAQMLRDAVRAFIDEDADLARKVMATEDEVDQLRSQINAEIFKRTQEGRIPMAAFTPLRTIARRLERASDQAKNICEEAVYVATGEYSKHPDADVWRMVFIDEHNHCRSQMAEAIGLSLGLPKFVFASAGIDPKPVDRMTIEFLKEKGIYVDNVVSRAVDHVPNLDAAQVIVALDPAAKRAFPKPTKAVCLDWSLPDPTEVTGSEEEKRAAYQAAYDTLRHHITDLCEAVLDDGID